jgi:hypothetical protein
MAGISGYQARGRGHQMPRASDIERELRRMRHDRAPNRRRSGAGLEVLLAIVIVGLLAFILTAGDGEGGLALLKAFATLFR